MSCIGTRRRHLKPGRGRAARAVAGHHEPPTVLMIRLYPLGVNALRKRQHP
jgi:hypothetical protein